MGQASSPGDVLLAWLVAYPRSVAVSLLAPHRLLKPTADANYCPPVVAFVLSLVLYFLAGSLVHRVELGVPGSIDFPSLGVLVGTTAWILLVLVAIRGTLVRGFRLVSDPPAAGLGLLTWPATIGLSTYAALILLMTLLPQRAVAAASPLGSGLEDFPETWKFPIIWTHAVEAASALPVLALFTWSLFNVIRVAFGATRARAAVATLAAVIVGLIVTGLFLGFSGGITRQVFLWTAAA